MADGNQTIQSGQSGQSSNITIPGQADIASTPAKVPNFADLASLPDVVRSNAQNANIAAQRYSDIAQSAFPQIDAINRITQDRTSRIFTQSDSAYSDILDANKKLVNITRNPFSGFIGLFDSDYNANYQRARISTGNVSLSALTSQLDAVKTARELGLNSIQAQVQSAREAASAQQTQLSNVAQAIDVQNNLLTYKDNVVRDKLHNLPDEAAVMASDAPQQFKNEELDRRKTLQLNLNSLEAQTKIVNTEATNLVQKTALQKANLDDPNLAKTLGFNPTQQQIQEEQNRRAVNAAEVPQQQALAAEAQIKSRQMQILETAKAMTTPQVIDLQQQAEKSPNKTADIVNPATKNKITLNEAEISAMLGQRTQIDTELAKQYGALAANKAGLPGAIAAGTTIMERLAHTNLASNADLLQNNGLESEINAHIKAFDFDGAAKAAKERQAAAQKIVDENVNKFDEASRPFIRQFLTTAPDAMSSFGQGDAAKYLVAQAVNGNAFRGTPLQDIGDAFTQNVKATVNKRLAYSHIGAGKDINMSDIANLFATNKLDAQQILREAMSMPVPGTATKTNPQGVTVQERWDSMNALKYLQATLSRLSSVGDASNPIKELVGPDGGLRRDYLDYNPTTGTTAFSIKGFVTKLEKLNSDLHSQGKMPVDKNLSDIVLQSMNDVGQQAAFGKALRSQYTIPEAALASLVYGGHEESILQSFITNMQANTIPARTNVENDRKIKETLEDTGKQMVASLNARIQNGPNANPADFSIMHTQYGDIAYNKRDVGHREMIEETLSKLRSLGMYSGNPANISNMTTVRSGAQ